MDKIDLNSLAALMGVSHPWSIKAVNIDEHNQIINVSLDTVKEKKKLFGFIESHSDKNVDNQVSGKWFHSPIGTFDCVIHADLPETNSSQAINSALIQQPAFIGSPERNYTNLMRQRVALAQIKGTPASIVLDCFGIKESIYKQITDDLDKATPLTKSLAYIPTEIDPVWRRVLSDQLLLRTNMLPFKLLLAKLKLSTAKAESAEQVSKNVNELRNFFMSNVQQLDAEIDQLCGVVNEQMRRQVSAVKTKQKLILPALKNPVWIDLLTGKLALNSQSVPLNLLISRQRVAFIQGKDSPSKVRAIETLREYFRRGHRGLKPELVLINRAIAINDKTKMRLPNSDHDIWQRILSDKNLIPSKHVAYNLLLSRLRAQVKTAQDPVVKLEAARSIRDFMQQNQRTLQRELSVIAKQSKAN